MRVLPDYAVKGIGQGIQYRASINHEIEDRNKSLINYANHMYEIAATAPGLSEEARNAYAASAANAMQATGATRGKYGETLPNQNPFRGTDTNWNNTPIKQWMNNQNGGGQNNPYTGMGSKSYNPNQYRGVGSANYNPAPQSMYEGNIFGWQPANNQQQQQPTAAPRYIRNPYRPQRTEYVTANPVARAEYVTR